MNRRALLLSSALCALLILPSSAGAATNACRAHAKKGRVVAQSPTGLAYYSGSKQGGSLYVNACSFRTGKSVRLRGQDGGNTNHVSDVLMNGRYLAYSVYDTEEAGTYGFSTVYSVDLKTRKTLVDEYSGEDHPAGEPNSTEVQDLVLGAKGAVAWINESGPADQSLSVHVASAGGGHAMIDIGSDIGARSLALAGDKKTIYWTRAGQVKTAALP